MRHNRRPTLRRRGAPSGREECGDGQSLTAELRQATSVIQAHRSFGDKNLINAGIDRMTILKCPAVTRRLPPNTGTCIALVTTKPCRPSSRCTLSSDR